MKLVFSICATLLLLLGCGGGGGGQRSGAHDESTATPLVLQVSQSRTLVLEVSPTALKATISRGPARLTYEAERGKMFDPSDLAFVGIKRDPEIDPPGQSSTLMTDRRGHVISINGDSYRHPGQWSERLKVLPTRTSEELQEDLAVAKDLPELLMKDERVRSLFRWEMRFLRTEIKDIKEAKAPDGTALVPAPPPHVPPR